MEKVLTMHLNALLELLTRSSQVSFYVLTTFVSPYLSNLLDPDREKKERANLQAKAHLDRLKQGQRTRPKRGLLNDHGSLGGDGPSFDNLDLNEYENRVALEMVAAADIPVGFDGGFELAGFRYIGPTETQL